MWLTWGISWELAFPLVDSSKTPRQDVVLQPDIDFGAWIRSCKRSVQAQNILAKCQCANMFRKCRNIHVSSHGLTSR